jgi:hypothetical protein
LIVQPCVTRVQWTAVRGRFSLLAAASAGVAVLVWTGAAGAAVPPPKEYGLRRLDDPKSRASLPFAVPTAAPPCNPLVPGVPDIITSDFDPSTVDELSVSGDARAVAWATTITEAGLPGATRDIVIYRDEVADRVRASDANGDNDQPSLDGDRFGLRMAFRGSDGARGTTTGNVYLRTVTKKPAPEPAPASAAKPVEEVATVNVTNLVATTTADNFGTAYDPSLSARMRHRDVGSGVKVLERDARLAFVSTGDLVPGRNEAHRPQLFVWREQDDDFVQITSIGADGFAVNRPSITAGANRIAFECNADLTPGAVDPRDPGRVGNPGRVRQIYLWDHVRGIRQLTWSDRDCIAPRIARNGRFVVFCSRGDLIPGGNPEANFEVFAWVESRDATRAVRQMTRTQQGHNVLPRPTTSPSTFAFWSSCAPADGSTPFGEGAKQCGTIAYLSRGGRVSRLGGNTDVENIRRAADSPDPESPENPIFAGPPCPGSSDAKIQFVTNDPRLNVPKADDDLDGQNGGKDDDGNALPDDRDVDASLLILHVARASRYAK